MKHQGNPFVQFFAELQRVKSNVPLESKILIIKDALNLLIVEYKKDIKENTTDERVIKALNIVISGAKQTLKNIEALEIGAIKDEMKSREQIKNIKQ